jgi:hypothetical protein
MERELRTGREGSRSTTGPPVVGGFEACVALELESELEALTWLSLPVDLPLVNVTLGSGEGKSRLSFSSTLAMDAGLVTLSNCGLEESDEGSPGERRSYSLLACLLTVVACAAGFIDWIKALMLPERAVAVLGDPPTTKFSWLVLQQALLSPKSPSVLGAGRFSLSMETGVNVASGGCRQGIGDEESAGELDIGGDGPSFSASVLSCMASR